MALSGLDLDLYWLGLHLDEPRATNGTAGAVNRQTLGGRLFGTIPQTPIQVDLEAAVQVGSVGTDDILAGMIATLFTWPFESVPLEPAVYLGYDWASGDSKSGGKVGTFDQLYPLAHRWLGRVDVVARQNIHSIQGGVSFSPVKRGVLDMNWLAFWLDDVNDALYSAPGDIIRLDPTASSKQVGVEVDITFKYEFLLGFDTLLGYSHFFAGDYLSETGADKDIDFGFIILAYTF
jgi:hypothetical protein